MHYQRWRKHGSPATHAECHDPIARFFAYTDIPPEPDRCWSWRGEKITRGYGRIYVFGRRKPAHRFAFELFVGEIAEGRHIHHRCRNTSCVNPDHLKPLTPGEHLIISGAREAARQKAAAA